MSDPQDYWLQYFSKPYEDMQAQYATKADEAALQKESLLTQRDSLGDNSWADSGRSFGAAALPFLAGLFGGDPMQGLEWGAKSGLAESAVMGQEDERKRGEINSEIGILDKNIENAREFGDQLSLGKYKNESELGMNYLMGKFPGTEPSDTLRQDDIEKAQAIYGSRVTATQSQKNEVLSQDDIDYYNKNGFNLKPGDKVGDFERQAKVVQLGQNATKLDDNRNSEGRRVRALDAQLGGDFAKGLDTDTSKALRGAMSIEPVMAPFMKKYEEFRATLPESTPAAFVFNKVMANIPTTEQSKFRKWLRGEGLQTAVAIMGSAGLSEREGQTIASAYSDEFAVDDAELFEAMAALKTRSRARAESALQLALSQPSQKVAATAATGTYLATLPPEEQEAAKQRIFIKPLAVPGVTPPSTSTPGSTIPAKGPQTPEEKAAFEAWKQKKGLNGN
jgi:hypothetical protein